MTRPEDALQIELARWERDLAAIELQLQAVESLAALRALGKVVLRFGREFEIPRLSVQLMTEQSEQPTTAVHTYERELQ